MPFCIQERFLEHAQTVAGGRHTAKQAQCLWESWDAGPDHPRDYDGPNGSLQLHVRTDIQLSEYVVYLRGKSINGGDKQVKDCFPLALCTRAVCNNG